MLKFFRDVYLVLSGRDELGDKVGLPTSGIAEARAAAARFSRNNIAIQQSSFVTGADLERERARFLRHRLS